MVEIAEHAESSISETKQIRASSAAVATYHIANGVFVQLDGNAYDP